MSDIEVVDWSPAWPGQFDEVAAALREALVGVGSARVEHVGSTSVQGLAAKPILDVDVIVDATDVQGAVAALESVGYVHRGDLGVTGREAFFAPDEPRDAYASVKLALVADPEMDIDTYLAGKSAVLQEVLEVSGEFSADELAAIHRLNDATA